MIKNPLTILTLWSSISLQWGISGRSTPSGDFRSQLRVASFERNLSQLRDHRQTDTEQVWINIIHLNQLFGRPPDA